MSEEISKESNGENSPAGEHEGEPDKKKDRKTKLKEYFNEERIRRILPCALLAFGLSLMLFIAAPYEIFCNNIEEALVRLSDFLGFLILYFFVALIGIFAILFFVPRQVYKPVYAVFVALFLMFFVQSNYLTFGSHSLSGDNNEAGLSVGLIVLDAIIWAVVIAGFLLLVYLLKKKGITRLICIVVSVALIGTQLVNVLISSVNTDGLNSPKDNVTLLTTKNLTRVSTTGNVFMFLIDRFDGVLYGEPYFESNPEIFENLTGFTYYTDNVTLYGHTYPGSTNMLTRMRNEAMSRDDFLEDAYKNNKTLTTLDKEGYKINLFTDPFYSYSNFRGLPDYVENAYTGEVDMSVDDKPRVAAEFVLMGVYRSVPLFIKNWITGLTSNRVNGRVIYDLPNSDEAVFNSDTKKVHDYIASHEFTTTDEKIFSFVHLYGCHGVPYDENWNAFNGGEDQMIISVKNNFSIINAFIDKLKEIGAYKDATIIITGDHSAPYDDNKAVQEPRITAMMLKPAGESEGAMKTSKAQVSHDNMWATIFKSEGIEAPKGENGEDIFGLSMTDITEDMQMTRPFIWDYDFYSNVWKQGVYEITGDAHDFENWHLVKTNKYNKGLYD